MSTLTETLDEVLVEEAVGNNNEIVLYNDDVNTFDHVIESLVKICDHTWEQAEQCAILVLFNDTVYSCGSISYVEK